MQEWSHGEEPLSIGDLRRIALGCPQLLSAAESLAAKTKRSELVRVSRKLGLPETWAYRFSRGAVTNPDITSVAELFIALTET